LNALPGRFATKEDEKKTKKLNIFSVFKFSRKEKKKFSSLKQKKV
jgi:hypothetical protein